MPGGLPARQPGRLDAECRRHLWPGRTPDRWPGCAGCPDGALWAHTACRSRRAGHCVMDLILWRHAEAEEPQEGHDDLARPLTPRGEKQAARMAAWLDRQLPEGLRVLASPARRTEQTASALGRKFKMRAELLPGGTPQELLELVQ